MDSIEYVKMLIILNHLILYNVIVTTSISSKKKKKKKIVTTSSMGTDQILKLLTYKFMELTFKNIYT